MNSFKNLSKQAQHGLFLVLIGVTFLLFISGIITKILFYPLLIAGIGFVVYGLYECEVFDNVKVLNKYLPKSKSSHHKSHEHKK
ncbi:MAG: hypothetical protein P4L22_01860 [Candidatus Babeliales bacterium]|nr:hypothetical protein [Candidatus Babeliales bacterium]